MRKRDYSQNKGNESMKNCMDKDDKATTQANQSTKKTSNIRSDAACENWRWWGRAEEKLINFKFHYYKSVIVQRTKGATRELRVKIMKEGIMFVFCEASRLQDIYVELNEESLEKQWVSK